MLMNLIRIENEDNAVVCAKIIIDLHRAFRNVLEDQVQPFLDIVLDIFKNMEQTVKDLFDAPSTPIGSATVSLDFFDYYSLTLVFIAWHKPFTCSFS
jgi:transformation/transcription domain-associated protein